MGDLGGIQNRFLPKVRGAVQPQEVILYLGGGRDAFDGWEDLTISKSLDSLATSFKFKIPQKFREQNGGFKLSPGVRVQVNVNREPVIAGRVEHVSGRLSTEENTVEISGRSLTGDLVDCTVEGPLEYNNIGLDQLARELLKPFGLKVFLSANPRRIDKVSIKPGDTVFEILEKYARLQGFFWVTTREGNLRLAFAGNSRADSILEEGVNIKSAEFTLDETQRFQTYKVKGQSAASDEFPGVKSSVGAGVARDSGVARYRPYTMVAEGGATNDIAKKRAEWEAARRLGRSVSLSVTVQGWQQETGILWGLNQVMRAKIPTLGVDGEFLSRSIEHVRTQQDGTLTKIGLTLRDAYLTKPDIPKQASDSLEAIVAFSKNNPKAAQ